MKKLIAILALGSTLAWADGPLVINRPITIARPLPGVIVNPAFRPVLNRAALKPRLLVKENAFGDLNIKVPGANMVSEDAFKKLHSEGRLILSNPGYLQTPPLFLLHLTPQSYKDIFHLPANP